MSNHYHKLRQVYKSALTSGIFHLCSLLGKFLRGQTAFFHTPPPDSLYTSIGYPPLVLNSYPKHRKNQLWHMIIATTDHNNFWPPYSWIASEFLGLRCSCFACSFSVPPTVLRRAVGPASWLMAEAIIDALFHDDAVQSTTLHDSTPKPWWIVFQLIRTTKIALTSKHYCMHVLENAHHASQIETKQQYECESKLVESTKKALAKLPKIGRL